MTLPRDTCYIITVSPGLTSGIKRSLSRTNSLYLLYFQALLLIPEVLVVPFDKTMHQSVTILLHTFDHNYKVTSFSAKYAGLTNGPGGPVCPGGPLSPCSPCKMTKKGTYGYVELLRSNILY